LFHALIKCNNKWKFMIIIKHEIKNMIGVFVASLILLDPYSPISCVFKLYDLKTHI
jgi:hypothetical protein